MHKEFKLNNGDIMYLDYEDYEYFKNKTVYYTEGNYPSFNNSGEREYIHRYVIGAVKGDVVDHINRNILDNRKKNLRRATHSYNKGNMPKYNIDNPKSEYKGVTYDETNKNWISRVRFNNKVRFSGRFTVEEAAALAYNHYANKYFGEYTLENVVKVPKGFKWRDYQLKRKVSPVQSGYKYVTWDAHKKEWVALVRKESKQVKVYSGDSYSKGLVEANEFIIRHGLHLKPRYAREVQMLTSCDFELLDKNDKRKYTNQMKVLNKVN